MTARFYLAVGYAVAMAIGAARTASADGLAYCASFDDSSARLACYDRLAGRKAPPGMGKWRLDHRRSPLSGGDAEFLTLHAEQADPTALPPWLQPQLIISCDDNETQVSIAPQRRASIGTQEMDVVLRIDGGGQIHEEWQVSMDGLTVLRPNPVHWIKDLFGATRLEVGLRPYLDTPLDFTFDIEDLDVASPPLAKACHW
jgi:type VI secretion system VasI family protein